PVKAWVPLGGKDYSSVIARIPKDVDALVVVLGGADAVNFLNQYEQAGGDKPLIGGSITVSQDILNYRGKRRDSLVGTIAGTPIVTEVVKDAQGNLYNKVLRKIDNVNQTLGLPPAEFKIGSRDEPNCP